MAIRAAGERRTQAPLRLTAALLDCVPIGAACVDAAARVVFANAAFASAHGVEEGDDLGPAGLGAAVREAIGSGTSAAFDLEGASVRVLVLDDQHAGVVLAGPDADEHAALLRVATLVARDAPESALFTAVAEQVALLLGAQASSVLRFVGEERAVVVGTWRRDGTRGMPVNAELDFDRSNSALGRVRSTGRPARADSYEDARGELPRVMRAIGLRSSVAAPVLLGDEVWGAIVAATGSETPLADGSEHRIGDFAALVGQALANAEADRRLAASRRHIVEAADETRRRLEQDLHEGAQQHLVALTLKLRVARARADAGSEVAGLLDDALAEAMETNGALRELARGLHPAVLSERGLAAALQALAVRSVVPVSLHELPARRYPATVEATAYFIVLETLANADAHSQATEVAVAVSERLDRLVVEVRDDGIGGADPRVGGGLHALAHRIAAVGGRFELDSPPGRGTVVRAEIPVGR